VDESEKDCIGCLDWSFSEPGEVCADSEELVAELAACLCGACGE
jgi:hypothetical protein